MVLTDAIEEYGTYSRHELGHTTSTYYSYVSWQRNFAQWLEGQGFVDPPVREITTNLIRRYSYSLSGRNLRPRTVRGALHAIRALFKFLAEQGILSENPATEVRLPKKDAANRLLVTDEDLKKLLDAAGKQRSEFRCIRDHAVLAVLIFCGLRRSEVLDLRIQDVNLKDKALLVRQGKGQKSRTVYLCQEVLEPVREWLALRQKKGYTHDYLFCAENRQQLGENSLSNILEDVKAIAGLKDDPRIKPHSIRHAAATRLLRNGADIRSIQAWLGHSQLQTTAIYLHTDEEQVRKIAPLAGFCPAKETPEGFPEREWPRANSPQRGRSTRRRLAR